MVDHVISSNSSKLFLWNIVLIVSLLSEENKSPLTEYLVYFISLSGLPSTLTAWP